MSVSVRASGLRSSPALGPPRVRAAARASRDFAVLIPALDEAENAGPLFAALRLAFDRHALDGEVVFVDDGSSDDTYAVARRAAARFGSRATVLRHRVTRGKTQALLTAAAATRATNVVLFDADLQYAPDDIPRLLAELDAGWDVVTGRRIGRYDKQAVSAVYNRLSRWLFGVPARDLNGVKALRRAVLRDVPLRRDWHRFLVVLAHARGHAVTEVDVALHPRRAGTSKFVGGGRVLTGVGDLLVVWCYLKFSAKPMPSFGATGPTLTAAGAFGGAAVAAMRALRVAPPPIGYRPLLGLVMLLVSVGLTLVAFGLLAEMSAVLRGEVEALQRDGHA